MLWSLCINVIVVLHKNLNVRREPHECELIVHVL